MMEFRIADTFTDSLSKLTGQEQRAVKTTAFDLQLDPAHPSLRFHKLERAKDPNFWSIRVNVNIRLIVHKTGSGLMLCYVDHHDTAYRWAERRRLESHPVTGAAQLVEMRERIEEIVIHKPVEAPAPPLFAHLPEDALLAYGVPSEWLDEVRRATDDMLYDLIDHLPQEAAEALLDIVTGTTPQAATVAVAGADPFDHPDAQRRFRVLTNVEALERALDFPWEKWTVFLHPAQRQFVEREANGPTRISGSAGTGKTIVALHRAVFLARRHDRARVLLTTFSPVLSNALKTRLKYLAGNERDVCNRIRVRSLSEVGRDLYTSIFEPPQVASPDLIQALLQEAAAIDTLRFTPHFLYGEWSDVVDARQIKTRKAYLKAPRLGRKARMSGKQREQLWPVFEQARAELNHRGLVTWPSVFGHLTDYYDNGDDQPFDFVVVDEAQDVGIAELRFLAAIGRRRADSLFFTGDLGQRIFQQPYSWKSLGVDIRGRSHTLRINYRTSHQIRTHADRLLPSALTDVDGNSESRRGAVSVFNGPAPAIDIFEDAAAEVTAVGAWIAERLTRGLLPHEIGVFVRTTLQLERAVRAVEAAGGTAIELTGDVEMAPGHVAVSTMHLAKGLEFRAVVAMACDDEVLPLQERIERISDHSDLEDVYQTERHLLYVACTRARDELLVTGVDPASEFLDDLL
jgi:mRNA-degrading endonuclease RelE of RelBE toxin-antitoxin system